MTIFRVSRNRTTETPEHYFTILWQNYADSRNPWIKSQTTGVIASRRPHQDQVLPLPPGDKSGHQTLEFSFLLVTYRQKTIKVVPRQQSLFSRADGNLLALSRRIHFDVPSRGHEEIAGLVEEKGLIKMISRLEVDPQHGHVRRTTHQLESQRCWWSPSLSVNTPVNLFIRDNFMLKLPFFSRSRHCSENVLVIFITGNFFPDIFLW